MLTNEWLIAIGVGLFLAGGLVGFLIRMFAFGGSRKEADLARALEDAEKQLADYRQEVLERFSDTAEKFRRLNESYTDLHQQLAESAVALCGDEVTTPLLEVRKDVASAMGSEVRDEAGAGPVVQPERDPAVEPRATADAEAAVTAEPADIVSRSAAGEAERKPSADRPAAP